MTRLMHGPPVTDAALYNGNDSIVGITLNHLGVDSGLAGGALVLGIPSVG